MFPNLARDAERESPSYDGYSFFGKRIGVHFDDPAFQNLFRATYSRLKADDEAAPSATFTLCSTGTQSGTPDLAVHTHLGHLVEAFTRGTNRRRFTVRRLADSGATVYEVSDTFLGSEPVMLVGERNALLLDRERSYATTESIIFHTVLSLIPDYHIMHAGVVSWGENAVLLCGEANRGKSTLTLGLVRAGFKFLSDEIAFVDLARARVVPFPRAVGMRANSIRMFPEITTGDLTETRSLGGEAKWLVDPGNVYKGSVGEESRIEAIFFLEGFAAFPRLTPMRPSEAMFDCMKVTHCAQDDPLDAMVHVADIVNGARCYRLHSGSVHDTAAAIAELMGRR